MVRTTKATIGNGKRKPRARVPAGQVIHKYTELDKLKAVTAMRVAGREHMHSAQSMQAARDVLGSYPSDATLSKWATLYSPLVDKLSPTLNPALLDRSSVVQSTQEQVINGFIGIRDKALNLLNDETVLKAAVEKSPRDVAIIMGIAQDKLAALTAIPAEAMQVSQRLYQLCERLGENYVQLLEDNISVLESQHAEYNRTIDMKE